MLISHSVFCGWREEFCMTRFGWDLSKFVLWTQSCPFLAWSFYPLIPEQGCWILYPQLPYPLSTAHIPRECNAMSCWILARFLYISQASIINSVFLFGWQFCFSPLFSPHSPFSCSIYCQPSLHFYHISASKIAAFLHFHQGKGNFAIEHFVTVIKNYSKRLFSKSIKGYFSNVISEI